MIHHCRDLQIVPSLDGELLCSPKKHYCGETNGFEPSEVMENDECGFVACIPDACLSCLHGVHK